MSEKMLGKKEQKSTLSKVLAVAVFVNPFIFALHLIVDTIVWRLGSLSLNCAYSLAISILVSVSGYQFWQNLGRYMGGVFVGRVASGD